MKAVGLHAHGSADALVRMELPKPAPGSGQLLIRVIASSVNPADVRARSAGQTRHVARAFPLVLGYDFSGVVEACGPEETGFRPGDAFYGSASLLEQGANAQYVLADHRCVDHKPVQLDHKQAAALPLAGVTTLECLQRAFPEGSTGLVRVQGGAGGVGHLQIQTARAIGHEVIATAGRPPSLQACASLGAHRVIDYT